MMYAVLWSLTVAGLLVLFQNCGQGFETPGGPDDLASKTTNSLIVSGLPGPTDARASIQFQPKTPAGSVYDCYLNGYLYKVNCTSPWLLSPISNGDHTLRIVPENKTIAEFEYTWSTEVRDLTLLVNRPVTPTPNTSVNIHYSVVNSLEQAVSVQCTLDAGTAFDCSSSPIQLQDLAEGPHQLTLQLYVDGAVRDTVTIDWVVDTSMFELRIVDGPGPFPEGSDKSQFFAGGAVEYTLELVDSNSIPQPASARCHMNRYTGDGVVTIAALGGCNFPKHSFGTHTEDGQYSGAFYVTDVHNRTYQGWFYFTIDTTAVEDFEILVDNNFATHHRNVHIPVLATVDDPVNPWGNILQYRIQGIHTDFLSVDKDDSARRRSFVSLDNLSNGSYTVEIRYSDEMGNLSPVKSVSFQVVNTPTGADLQRGQHVSIDPQYLVPTPVATLLNSSTSIQFLPAQPTGNVNSVGVIDHVPSYWSREITKNHVSNSPVIHGHGTRYLHSSGNLLVLYSTSTGMIHTLDVGNINGPRLVQSMKLDLRYLLHQSGNIRYFLGYDYQLPVGQQFVLKSVDLSDPTQPVVNHIGTALDVSLPDAVIRDPGVVTPLNNGRFLAQMRDSTSNISYLAVYQIDGSNTISRLGYRAYNHDTNRLREVQVDGPRILAYSRDYTSSDYTKFLKVLNSANLQEMQDLSSAFNGHFLASSDRLFMNVTGDVHIYDFSSNSYQLSHQVDDFHVDAVKSKSSIYRRDYQASTWSGYQYSAGSFSKQFTRKIPLGWDYNDSTIYHNNYVIGLKYNLLTVYPSDTNVAYEPVFTLSLPLNSHNGMTKDGNRLLVAGYSSGNTGFAGMLLNLDISNPTNIRLLSSAGTTGVFNSPPLKVGNHVYVPGRASLNTFSLNPSTGALQSVHTLSLSSHHVHGFVSHNDRIYISGAEPIAPGDFSQMFKVFTEVDLSTPSSPRVRQHQRFPDMESGYERPLMMGTTHIYQYDRDLGTVSFDLTASNPLSTRRIVSEIISTTVANAGHPEPKIIKTEGGNDIWYFRNASYWGEHDLSYTHPQLGQTVNPQQHFLFFEVTYDGLGNPQVSRDALTAQGLYHDLEAYHLNIYFRDILFDAPGGRFLFFEYASGLRDVPMSTLLGP